MEFFSIISSGVSLLPKFKEEIIKVTKIAAGEIEHFMGRGLGNYLDKQIDKFYNTKTFIFRDGTVKFYETFFPVRLTRKGIQNEVISTSEILDSIFVNSNYITIIGTAGSGKTMLMKHVFLNAYYKTFKIPVVIELRHLNEYNGDIIDYIYNVILEEKITPNEKILEKIIGTGNFIFLLDGYDEIYSSNKDKRTKEIEAFVDRYSSNYFVITSRPGADAEFLSRFQNYYVNELNDAEIKQFIQKQLLIVSESDLSKKIIEVIDKQESQAYKEYLRSPLLLSMFIITFKQFPDLPKSKNKFYYNVFDTLVTKHDSLSKRGGFQHERKTGLQNEDIETILKWFSYLTLFNGLYSFDKEQFEKSLKDIKQKLNYSYSIQDLISDFTVSLSLIVIDGNEYKFPHKSFQEYFCSCLIRDLNLETKVKVYQTKMRSYCERAREVDNFIGLCTELDKHNFYQYFVIPTLEEFIDLLRSSQSSDEKIIKFNEITGFSIFIPDSPKTEGEKVTLFRMSDIYNILFEIYGLGEFFWQVFRTESLEAYDRVQIDELINEKVLTYAEFAQEGYEFDFDNRHHPLAKKILEQGSMSDGIDLFLGKIDEKIKELKNEIENEVRLTINLLDIDVFE